MKTIRIIQSVRIDGQRAGVGAVVTVSRSLAADLIRRKCAVEEEADASALAPKKGRPAKAAKKEAGEDEQ